ncbi:MAG: hypothetical protein ACK4GD_03355 [Sphingomonadaceae bacterium]
MKKSNTVVSAIAALLGLTGALLLVSLFTPMWNYSVAGAVLLTAAGLGVIASVCGWIARKGGVNALNNLGLGLGLVTVAASVAMMGYFTVEEPTYTQESAYVPE